MIYFQPYGRKLLNETGKEMITFYLHWYNKKDEVLLLWKQFVFQKALYINKNPISWVDDGEDDWI